MSATTFNKDFLGLQYDQGNTEEIIQTEKTTLCIIKFGKHINID